MDIPFPPLKLPNKRREEYSKNIPFIPFHSIPSPPPKRILNVYLKGFLFAILVVRRWQETERWQKAGLTLVVALYPQLSQIISRSLCNQGFHDFKAVRKYNFLAHWNSARHANELKEQNNNYQNNIVPILYKRSTYIKHLCRFFNVNYRKILIMIECILQCKPQRIGRALQPNMVY